MSETPPNARGPFQDLALCVMFYTRLPLPFLPLGHRSFAQAQWAAPVAGAIVGLAGGLVYATAVGAGLAAEPAAALALAATLAATGCLHEDGLADTADGFGGGGTRERKLEIMRDSRIGAYGACALGLSLLLRWSALSAIADTGQILVALVAAHAASRALVAAFMRSLPPARANGLSADAGRPSANTALLAAGLGGLALLALGPLPALACCIALGAGFVAFRRLCRDQIGGQTGDTIGALQQGGEIAVLLIASAFLS